MVKPQHSGNSNTKAQNAKLSKQPEPKSATPGNYVPTRAFNIIRQRLEAHQQQIQELSAKHRRQIQPSQDQLESLLFSIEPYVLELQKEQLDSSLFAKDLPLLQLTKEQLLTKLGFNNDTAPKKSAITPEESLPSTTTTTRQYNQFSPESFSAFTTWLNDLAAKENISDTGFGTLVDLNANLKEGTGLIALKDIKANDVVLKIPLSSMITPLQITNDPFYRNLLTLFPTINPTSNSQNSLSLPFVIIYERLRGKSSSFYPYLNLLPSYVSNIPFASLHDIVSTLQGSAHYFTALRIYLNLVQQYVFVLSTIALSNDRLNPKVKPLPSQQPTQVGFIQPFSFLIYRWAISMAMSRQNPVPLIIDKKQPPTERTMALIPGFDFGNHFIPQDDSLSYINTNFNIENFASETDALVDVKQGEQFYIYYGNRPTSQFALYQGFVPQSTKTSTTSTKEPELEFISSTASCISPQEDELQTTRLNIRQRLGLDGFIFTIPLQLHTPTEFDQKVEDSTLAQQELQQHLSTWTRVWKATYIESLDKDECATLSLSLSKFTKPTDQNDIHLQQHQLAYDDAIISNTNENMLRSINKLIQDLDQLRVLQQEQVTKAQEVVNKHQSSATASTNDVRIVLNALFNVDISNYQNQVILLQRLANKLKA